MKLDLRKEPHQQLKGYLTKPTIPDGFNPSLKEITRINYDLELHYLEDVENVQIQGEVKFKAQALDALNGQPFTFQETFVLDEVYSTDTSTPAEDLNFLEIDDFNFEEFILGEVALNIPIVLTESHGIISKNGLGWEVLSESTYQENKADSNEIDSRWDKLDKWKINE